MARPSTSVLHNALKDAGITHVVGIPDNSSAALYDLLDTEPSISLCTVTREGEAFAVASGLWVGGAAPLVLIQNTGLLESGDSLRGTAVRMGVPLPIIITYRGYAKSIVRGDEHGPPWSDQALVRHDLDSVALLTEPTLKAWGIDYFLYHTDEDVPLVSQIVSQAEKKHRPVALILTDLLQ